MDNEGETALIPAEMVSYSVSAAPTINLEATLRLLAAPAQMPAEVPNSAASDPVIRCHSLTPSLLPPPLYSCVCWKSPLISALHFFMYLSVYLKIAKVHSVQPCIFLVSSLSAVYLR